MTTLDISFERRRTFSPDSPARAPVKPAPVKPAPMRPPGKRRRMGGPVVPQSTQGRYRRIKWAVMALCLALYGLLPFLRYPRGAGEPAQAVLVDLDKVKLYFFSIEIWPQQFYLVTGLLILATTTLILVNSIAGRIWCGFACPQTVWTDLFIFVERLVEGDRRERLRKREEKIGARRIGEIALKHAIWIAISVWTGATLLFYFNDAPALALRLVSGEAGLLSYAGALIVAAVMYLLAGFAREQMCIWGCPWPRLQGAIWDPEALTVNYRDYRGEQRMSAKKAAEQRALGGQAGDCVDCNQCVVVCPIGIDIREGPNFACINCGLCVDACDGVMTKLGRERGLIDFESWRNIERGRAGLPAQRRILRPKIIGLAAALVVIAGGMAAVLGLRETTGMFIQHDRNPLAVALSDGRVMNGYTLRLRNNSSVARVFTLTATGLPDLRLALVGETAIAVPPEAAVETRFTISGPRPSAPRPLHFEAVDGAGLKLRAEGLFFPQ